MAVVRRNIMTDAGARTSFIDGVLALKSDFLGTTTANLGLPGTPRPVSTYDLFIAWHELAMARMTPPTQGDRNSAHSGPVFLPWHRYMLILFELQLQRVLGNNQVGLPYWDWASDGDLPASKQRLAPLWTSAGIGGSGSPVSDGPFRTPSFTVNLESGNTGALQTTNRGLVRQLGTDVTTLPTTAQVKQVLNQKTYDVPQWDRSTTKFRNRLEGWRPSPGPRMHNRVHVWVGGDMSPATSPNDPVFYLNHCNVDRIWEAWMTRRGRVYAPTATTTGAPVGHRVNDPLYSILVNKTVTPADVLEVSSSYSYDHLP